MPSFEPFYGAAGIIAGGSHYGPGATPQVEAGTAQSAYPVLSRSAACHIHLCRIRRRSALRPSYRHCPMSCQRSNLGAFVAALNPESAISKGEDSMRLAFSGIFLFDPRAAASLYCRGVWSFAHNSAVLSHWTS